MTQAQPSETLVDLLIAARRRGTRIPADTTIAAPAGADEAYGIQAQTLAALGERAGGWKVGAKEPGGLVTYAPLPASRVHGPDVGVIQLSLFGRPALELEIAFCFDGPVAPAKTALSQEAVFARVAQMLVTVEIVDSRFETWPRTDALAQLADLQNHGALVTSARVPYDEHYDFAAPVLSLAGNGKPLYRGATAGRGANTAGDPRWLVTSLVNELGKRGIGIAAGEVITAGSYTGIVLVEEPMDVAGEIAGIGKIAFRFA
jgi:2-keto-4-pentenoate hydratase